MVALRLLSLLLVGGSSSVVAFAPIQPQATRISSSLAAASPLEEVGSDDSAPVDPFDAYEQTSDQRTVMFKDYVEGTGPEVTPGMLCEVTYSGRLMASNKQFDKSDAYCFKLGEGKVIPGWEQGVPGMKVGGKRTLRIPPNLAYGDQWFKGTIPPSSHLEFDVEMLRVAEGGGDEFMMKLENYGIGRAVGMATCLVLAVTAPQIGAFITTVMNK